MKLDHIKEEVCPTCGAVTVSESKHHKHCNGHYNESRAFACGAVIKWSPNFMCEHDSTICPNSPEEKEKREKREKAKVAIKEFIRNLDVDNHFKQNLLSYHVLSSYNE